MSGLAAHRDASWYVNPNTRTPKVLHAATDDGMAQCDPLGTPLAMQGAVPIAKTNRRARCGRAACSAAFAFATTPIPDQHDHQED